MGSGLISLFRRGLEAMRFDSRLLLVGILVFIFPVIFIWATHSFYLTAYDNIHTAEKLRVGMVHDTFSAYLSSAITDTDILGKLITSITKDNDDITALRIYRESQNGMLVVAAEDSGLVGQYDPQAETIKEMGFSNVLDFQMRELQVAGVRYWNAYRRVVIDNDFYYIFSQHDLSRIDKTMAYRRQQSYLGLTAVFLFLIGLAYWIHRQSYWHGKYEKLSETLHERDLFSNMIAHEFRSPLTAIKGYASFLEESTALPPDERRFASNIRQSAEHLVELVSDFLEVARLQSGKLKIEKQLVDVRGTVSTTVENLTGMAAEKGLHLVYDPGSKPVMFETDASRLLQVLTNLVTNAIKYTKSGTVTLSCTEEYKTVVIRVMDTGMGISAEDQQKLFAPFTRVGGVDAAQITGTGLGMYITKQLVSLLGGSIGVESIKGVGTHLVVTLKVD
ncbi:MAG: HAMP domain-containing histidine kinase [Candidatus Pacebacteria bacterium]|nr:HAMP domain-containing histidine kinase [Candidatus Paceibacterota bacterium]